MTFDDVINELKTRITAQSPAAVTRVTRVSDEEGSIRAYAPADHEDAIRNATRDYTMQLLIEEGLDVQVFVYDIATSLPPDEQQ